MFEEEDFFEESLEFAEQVIALKDAMSKSIKGNILYEMERLKRENEELQKVKRDWEAIKREHAEKARQFESARKNLEDTVRRERLDTLLEPLRIIRFRAVVENKLGPKCDKCDDNREVEYITPLGRKKKEDCECNVRKRVYQPEEYLVSEFSTERNGQQLNIWYKRSRYADSDHEVYDSRTDYCKVIYASGMSYENLKTHETFFDTQAECQAYCDWLNAKGDKKV